MVSDVQLYHQNLFILEKMAFYHLYMKGLSNKSGINHFLSTHNLKKKNSKLKDILVGKQEWGSQLL